MFISGEKIARLIINVLSDSRISLNQWKFDIPDHLTNQHFGIVANAKNLADGINYQIERKGLDISDEILVVSRDKKEYATRDGKVVRNEYIN